MELSENTIRKMSCLTSQSQGFDNMVELKAAVDAAMFHKGPPLYVVFLDGARRGTIGRLAGYGYRKGGSTIHFDGSFNVEIDGRSTLRMGSGEVSWLKGYDGPTVWKYTRKEKEPAKKIVDKAGTELAVGDTVVVADDDTLYLGRLDRRSDKGTIWVKEIKMRPDEVMMDEPVKIMSVFPDRVLKLDSALMDKIVLAKLAN